MSEPVKIERKKVCGDSLTFICEWNGQWTGLIFGRFIAVLGYIPMPKSIFFPNFWMKIPNFKSEKSSFLSWQKLA